MRPRITQKYLQCFVQLAARWKLLQELIEVYNIVTGGVCDTSDKSLKYRKRSPCIHKNTYR